MSIKWQNYKEVEMQEQQYILENVNSFEPKHIFDCGQCFRWNKQEDDSYTGVVQNYVLNVKKERERIIVTGIGEENIQEICTEYFDLKRDYEEIKRSLSRVDKYLKQSISYGQGIRILNQDLWETIISFIISANNNIPRIKGIIERLSKAYGNKIEWRGKEYYTFPTIEQLSQADIKDLRALGLGFRDKYIYQTTKQIVRGQVDLKALHEEPNTQKIRKVLLSLSGIGPKVADCILLFSTLKRFDVFPIDVWVRRVMNDLYIQLDDENKVSKSKIEELARQKYGKLEGIAQQYLFYWKRNLA